MRTPGRAGMEGAVFENLWSSADGLLRGADTRGALANKLGPLAALGLERRGEPVPAALRREARLARASWLAAAPLLGRVRALHEGPLLLMKGPEVAALYPQRARAFVDLDLLAPDARALHAGLRRRGFRELVDPDLRPGHHHLAPLQCPGLWLPLEIHVRPMWPAHRAAPDVAGIVAAAVPSATGLAGLMAPHPAHHAVLLAAHAWVHEPLHTVRDLLDIAAVASRSDEATLDATARAWGLERIWRTTYGAAQALLGDGRRSWALHLWGRHLTDVGERTVLGNHLQRWLHGFAETSASGAIRELRLALRQVVLPYPGETWHEKGVRVRHAVAHPHAPLSRHREEWRREAGGE